MRWRKADRAVRSGVRQMGEYQWEPYYPRRRWFTVGFHIPASPGRWIHVEQRPVGWSWRVHCLAGPISAEGGAKQATAYEGFAFDFDDATRRARWAANRDKDWSQTLADRPIVAVEPNGGRP